MVMVMVMMMKEYSSLGLCWSLGTSNNDVDDENWVLGLPLSNLGHHEQRAS